MIIPKGPNKRPPIRITIKISSGCDFTDAEKTKGCVKKLSINCPIANPINTKMVLGSVSVAKLASRLLVMVKKTIKKDPMIGPKNGMIFSSAQTSDMVTAFGMPKINKTIV